MVQVLKLFLAVEDRNLPISRSHIITDEVNSRSIRGSHGPLTRYAKLWVAHATGMPGTFLRHRLQRKLLVRDPGMYQGTCVTHMSWCMSGSLTRGGENVPGIPGAWATHNFTYLARGPWKLPGFPRIFPTQHQERYIKVCGCYRYFIFTKLYIFFLGYLFCFIPFIHYLYKTFAVL